MNYTKGEWRLTNYSGRAIDITAEIEKGITTDICTITSKHYLEDAYLISAAPNMHKELKESTIMLNLLTERLSKYEEVKAVRDQIANNNQALSKAELK